MAETTAAGFRGSEKEESTTLAADGQATTTGSVTLKSVPAQKEIESRLLNTTEEFDLTTEQPVSEEDRTTVEPKLAGVLEGQAVEPVEGETTTGTTLKSTSGSSSAPDQRESDETTTATSLVREQPDTETTAKPADHETSSPVALAVTLAPASTTTAAALPAEKSGADQEESTTAAAPGDESVQTTTTVATTRAEPKRISIGDILIGSVTTESAFGDDKDSSATTTVAPIESDTEKPEESTEFMYPMSEDEKTADTGKLETGATEDISTTTPTSLATEEEEGATEKTRAGFEPSSF